MMNIKNLFSKNKSLSINPEAGKSYMIVLKIGKTFNGWYENNVKYFYEYGTSGRTALIKDIQSIKEITWEKAVSNLDEKGIAK